MPGETRGLIHRDSKTRHSGLRKRMTRRMAFKKKSGRKQRANSQPPAPVRSTDAAGTSPSTLVSSAQHPAKAAVSLRSEHPLDATWFRDCMLAKWWLGIPVLVGLLIRTIYHAELRAQSSLSEFLLLDSVVFSKMASDILDGDLLAGTQPFSVGPLYAYALAIQRALFGIDWTTTLVVQSIVGVGNVGLVTLVARRFASPVGACLAGVAYAAYAPALLLETKLLGETYCVFLTLLATWLLSGGEPVAGKRISWRRLAGSGTCLGAACLARPDLLLFLPLGLAWIAGVSRPLGKRWRSVEWRAVLAWSVPVVFVVGLATARNYEVTGEFIPISTQGGVTFYQGNNPRAEGTFSVPEQLSGNKITQEREAKEVAERDVGRTLSHREVDEFWFGRGVDYLTLDPRATVHLIWRKFAYWVGSAELSAEYSVKAERCLTSSLDLAFVPFGAMLAALVLGGGVAHRRAPALVVLLGAFVLSALLTGLIFFVTSRYRLAAAAHLAVFVGPAYDQVARWVKGGWAGASLRLVVAASILGLSLLPGRRAERFQAASEFYNLGNSHYRRGEFEAAVSSYLTALSVRPEYWQLQFNLAQAYASLGDQASASKHMSKVIQLNPNSEKAHAVGRRFAAVSDAGRNFRGEPLCEL